jgi:hypothetical protein
MSRDGLAGAVRVINPRQVIVAVQLGQQRASSTDAGSAGCLIRQAADEWL